MKSLKFDIFSVYRGELMGIAILGVCIAHALVWAHLDTSIASKILGPFTRIAFTEGFLFLSGLGLYYSFQKNDNINLFYKKRINRVFIPYVIMAFPFLLYDAYSGEISLSEFILRLSALYFWFYGNEGMWYISISLALYFIFPLVYKFLFSENDIRHVAGKVTLIAIGCILLCFLMHVYVPNYYAKVEIGLSKVPVFFIGMFAGFLSYRKTHMPLKYFIGGGTLVITTYLLKKEDPFWIVYYEIALRLILMPLACIVLMLLHNKKLNNIFSWLGKYSLEIYVLQMFMIGAVDTILKSIGYSSDFYYIILTTLSFMIVFIICSPLHRGIASIINKVKGKK